MTTNAITYYPTLIKSYFVDKMKNSVFNTPIVRTAFVASTVVFTGITTVYFVKKINDTARVALNRPLETACIAAAIVSTGVVIAHYPIWTMILFVGISFILLNRQSYTKIQEINKASQDFFINSPFIKKIQIFGTNAKLASDSENRFPITQLELKEIQFKVAQSDKAHAEDTIPPIVAVAEEVTSEEEVCLQDTEFSTEENKVTDTAVSVASTLVEETEEVTLQDQSVDTLLGIESIEEVLSEDVTINSQSFEEEDIAQVAPTHTDTIEEVASKEANGTIVSSSLGLVEQCKLMNQNFKNVPASNSSILAAAKAMNQFTLDDTTLEKINLTGLDQQKTDKAYVTLPIQPVTFASVKTCSNYKPFEKPVKRTLVHPFMPKNGIATNKVLKTTETLLQLLKKVHK